MDLGVIQSGVPSRVAFKFVCQGCESILLVSVRPECSCVVVELPRDKEILEGESRDVVLLWTAESGGFQRKNLVVQYICGDVLYSKVLTFYADMSSSVLPDKLLVDV